MKTIEINLYKFEELSDEAKEKAIEKWRNGSTEIFWAAENQQSMEKFAEVFPIKVNDWSYGGRGEGVYFSMTCDDAIEELSGQRLATYIWNNYQDEIYGPKQYWICQGHRNAVGQGAKHRNSKVWLHDELQCVLTGYYMDNEILAPLFDFMRKPEDNYNLKEVLEDCFNAWIKSCNADIEHQNSDETITETLTSNDYEFTVDGEIY